MRRLHLVRHGRSLPDKARPPEEWPLDPEGYADLAALRTSGRLPAAARWFSSSETKAVETARHLTDGPVTVLDGLREHRREVRWFDDPREFRATVRRAFAAPAVAAVPEWEPLQALRDRLLPAVRRILAQVPTGEEIVLAGHGTAWTLLVAELTGRQPDLEAWARLRMPDLWLVDVPGD
jgi:broad specificity phosphatase PhoE